MSRFADAMKTYYLEAIRDNTNRATVLLKNLRKEEETVGGNHAYMSLLRRGNPGVGSRADGAALPTASYSRYSKATFGLFSLYGRFEITGKTIRSSKGNRAAYAEAIDTQMQSLMKDLPSEHNRALFNDGSGALTTCAVTGGATAVNVDSTQYLQADDIVDIRTAAGGTLATGGDSLTIVSVLNSTQFEVASAITTSTIHSVYREDSRNQEIYGLEAVCATSNPSRGNFGGIDRTAGSGEFFQGNILHNSGTNRPLTRGLMQQGVAKSRKRGAGEIDLGICDDDMWITYGQLLAPDQRFGAEIFTMDGGFEALRFRRIPITPDKDCKPNRMFLLETKTLAILQTGDYQWLDMDGSIIKWRNDYDAWQAVIAKDAELGCSNPNRQVWIKDLSNNLN